MARFKTEQNYRLYMSRQKKSRFAATKLMDNIVEFGKDNFLTMPGKWNSEMFENENPIVLELACGKGEYTEGLAFEFPDRNFIGMDIKGARLYVGAKSALDLGLKNVAFVRGRIESLRGFFGWREISELWITFPDPRPKAGDEKRRLTHPRFLRLYQHILKPGGIIHLKTDNPPLFRYSVEMVKEMGGTILAQTTSLYESPWKEDHHGIQTYFENKFTQKGFSINYLRFQLPELEVEDGKADPVFYPEMNGRLHKLEV